MTYVEAVSKVQEKFAKVTSKSFNSDFAIQVTIKDEDSKGTFYIANIGGAFSVEPYDYRDNSVAIDIMLADIIKIAEGKLKVSTALEKGRIDYFGDIEALENIYGAIKPEKKATPKKKVTKPAEKKVEKKAAPAPKKEEKKATKPAPKKTVKKADKQPK